MMLLSLSPACPVCKISLVSSYKVQLTDNVTKHVYYNMLYKFSFELLSYVHKRFHGGKSTVRAF